VNVKRLTVPDLQQKKKEAKKITMLTAYDFPFAQIVDEAGVDIVLIGDSLGMVVQGLSTTLPVTMDEMIYHTRMVSRAVNRALVMGDMPFLSFQGGMESAVRNAGRFLKEGGASAVKIEGGAHMLDTIHHLYRSGIPVMAHIGLTPQSVHKFGGYQVQGRTPAAAARLMEEAKMVEEAGAFGILLESVPVKLAKEITESVGVPTIGIGAGPHCDGQVVVLHDLVGLFDRFKPKYVRRYADIKSQVLKAVQEYKQDVEGGRFPGETESYE
jgi:3-methyl-2-oxobutanoate hydroxymethyltransferase